MRKKQKKTKQRGRVQRWGQKGLKKEERGKEETLLPDPKRRISSNEHGAVKARVDFPESNFWVDPVVPQKKKNHE